MSAAVSFRQTLGSIQSGFTHDHGCFYNDATEPAGGESLRVGSSQLKEHAGKFGPVWSWRTYLVTFDRLDITVSQNQTQNFLMQLMIKVIDVAGVNLSSLQIVEEIPEACSGHLRTSKC